MERGCTTVYNQCVGVFEVKDKFLPSQQSVLWGCCGVHLYRELGVPRVTQQMKLQGMENDLPRDTLTMPPIVQFPERAMGEITSAEV